MKGLLPLEYNCPLYVLLYKKMFKRKQILLIPEFKYIEQTFVPVFSEMRVVFSEMRVVMAFEDVEVVIAFSIAFNINFLKSPHKVYQVPTEVPGS